MIMAVTISPKSSSGLLPMNLQFFAKAGSDSEKVLGGRFADVDKTKGTNEVWHHIAQNAYSEKIGIQKKDGTAILMTEADHVLTRTYRGRRKATMRADAELNVRQRMVLDIKDIKEQFGRKYNKGMMQMIDYTKTLPQYQK